ncbi:hypothetical protein, partial [Escherichia coli]|uniref:hypothetical protein n=1 Tax=Escherichia coli TaxID=562 RepID=UPI001BAFB8A7
LKYCHTNSPRNSPQCNANILFHLNYFTFNVVPRYKIFFVIPFIYIVTRTENGKENKKPG